MNKHLEAGPNQVICQLWEESERCWGVRPDGFSLHLTREDLHRFIREYNDTLPRETAPIYSRPVGEAYPAAVSDAVAAEIAAQGSGLWLLGYAYPDPMPR